MELKREIYNRLLSWKISGKNKAFLLKGARQTGKTYIIRKFGKENYGSFIEINFFDNPDAISVFDGNLDSRTILANLSALYPGTRIIPGKTLIFLDEIQECPRAISALKPLAADPIIDVAASGSLLGLNYNSFPSYPTGYTKEEVMYPLSFHEFAEAFGLSEAVFSHIRECFMERKPINTAIHKSLSSLWMTYIIIGGMPDAVSAFIDTRNFDEALEIQRTLYNQYAIDISKYAEKEDKAKIHDIYSRVPAVLSSGSRRFMLSEISRSARFERYESGFRWLYDSGTVLPCFNVKEPMMPLEINAERNLQKLFMSDTGMLSGLTIRGSRLGFLKGEMNTNLGYIFENAIAQELKAAGHDLFYFDRKSIGEVDFLIQEGLSIVPVEVKSGRNWRCHRALDKLIAIDNYRIRKAFVLSESNIEEDGKVLNMPWYMTMFMKAAGDEDTELPELSELERLL